nr:phosphatidylinositol-glycan biosynthesis class X protein isoform X1 [Anolis sagrei ordinatus]XP_060623972.1 phosphatidylinositol-glycan biosynthesis class X protein isoform X1 [Anolis sagrei ordinatus]
MDILPLWIISFLCILQYTYAQNKCPDVMQQLLKDGFHRDLLIKINLGIFDEGIRNCTVATKVHLPRGLYVDPYELISLQKYNLTEALVISDNIDLEVPEYLATDITVLVYMKPDSECQFCFKALLPLHCRYHRPTKDDGRIFTVLQSPEILISCQKTFLSVDCLQETEIEAPCSQQSINMCRWDSLKLKNVKKLKLQIPVGFNHHFTLVCAGTLITTILCSSLILSSLYKHGHFFFVQGSL